MLAGALPRVLIAEDSPLFRDSLARSIQADRRLELVGQARDGRHALELIHQLHPDVCLLDVRMPLLDGPGVIVEIRKARLDTRAVLLSAHIDGALIHRALAAGAAGCLDKDAEESEIASAIIRVAAGETVLSDQLQPLLATYVGQFAVPTIKLSAREREVLQLASQGRNGRQIALDLTLSPESVRTFLRRASAKLGVNGQTAAVAEALRRDLL
ncbi:MAG: response regulator transcription factor [Actinomycetota bacterium]|nr:response regulator transcription factor [Actinomycetota bacterium]